MPSLIDYQSVVGRGSLIPAIVDDAFEGMCIDLLTRAYDEMIAIDAYSNQWKETRFSAHLVKYMRQLRDQADLNLRIDPEHHVYREEILNGTDDPDTSARIDIRIMGGWVREDVYYSMEGKILVEKDWMTRRASALRERYIETGIDHYKNGDYSSEVVIGCVVGYVVHGQPQKVSTQINRLLSTRNRRNEHLRGRHAINSCSCCYTSEHLRVTDRKIFRIRHVLLDCT